MICQICKKNDATVTITKVAGVKKIELYICNDCAHSLLGSAISSFSFSQYNINEILGNLLSSFIKLDRGKGAEGLNKEDNCPHCGMTYQEFVQSGKLGCNQCYEYFRKQLNLILCRLHGNAEHIGKLPPAIKERNIRLNRINEIKDEMQKLILKEEYEQAAKLRDRIIEEEKRLEDGNNEQ